MASSKAVCRYIVTARAPGIYDLRMTVRDGEAIHPLDTGVTELLAISRETAESELNAMRELGYELRSELRTNLATTGII